VPTVNCPCCKGAGRIELTGVYADTLALLTSHGKEATGAELSKVAGCKPTAMNNRLARLQDMGLVESRQYGRLRLFRVPDPTNAKE